MSNATTSEALDSEPAFQLNPVTLTPEFDAAAAGCPSDAGAAAAPGGGSMGRPIVWIGFAVSVVFLYFFLRNVHWAELASSLEDAHYIYILPALFLWFVMLWVRALRWQVMVRHLKPVSMMSLCSSTLIGFMASGVLPARAGEIVRAAVLARREGLKVSGVFATIVVERLCDLLAVIFFLMLVVFYLPVSGANAAIMDRLRFFGFVFGAIIAAAVVFLAMLKTWPDRVKQVLSLATSRLPGKGAQQVEAILDNFIEGLGMLRGWREVLWITVLSVLLWLVIGLVNWSLSFAFDLHMSVLGGCLIFVVTAFAIAVPQAPSFIGVFHVAVETSLRLLDVTSVSAKSYAIVLWAVSAITPIVFGTLALWLEGMSLGELTRAKDTRQD